MTRLFLLLIIVIVASGFLVPVKAFSPAQTSSISGLSYPSNVVVGAPLVVSFNVAYSVGSYSSLWLITAIVCGPNEPNCSFVSPKGVSSTPVSCNSANPFGNQYPLASQTCYLTVSSSSSEVFSYSFSFNQVGTYYLTALSQLNVPYNSYDIQGSFSVSQTMVITVNAPSAQGGNIIYGGTLSGLPPDGTISQVSFSVEGGDLVTVFQVQGQISTTYAYMIVILVSPNFSPNCRAGYIIAYNVAQIGPGAYFVDSSSQRQTPISSSTVTGNSWTASIPLTWIGNLAHFWADAATSQTSGGITSPIDRAPRNSNSTEVILPSTAPVTTLFPGCSSSTYATIITGGVTAATQTSSTTTSTTSYATTSAISSIGTAYFSNQAWNPEFGTVVYSAIIVVAIAVGTFYILHKRKH